MCLLKASQEADVDENDPMCHFSPATLKKQFLRNQEDLQDDGQRYEK